MGLFGIFKKDKEAPEPLPKISLQIGQLDSWFRENFSEGLDQARASAQGHYTSVMKTFDGILEANKKLREKRLEGTDRVHSSARMVKKSFVQRVSNSLSKKTRPGRDFSSLKSFHSEKSKLIQDLLNMPPKHAILLSRYSGREAETLIASMKRALSKLDGMESFLKTEASLLMLEEAISSGLSDHRRLRAGISELDRKSKKLAEEARGFEEKLSGPRKALAEFLEGPEWKEKLRLEEQSESLKARIREKELAIVNTVSGSGRALKKIGHLTRNKAISAFTKNPLQTLVSGQDIRPVIRQGLSEGSLGGREREKLETLARALETGIPKLLEARKELLQEQERVSGLIKGSTALSRKTRLEDDVRTNEIALKRVREELKNTGERLSGLKTELKDLKRSLEKSVLEHASREVTLDN